MLSRLGELGLSLLPSVRELGLQTGRVPGDNQGHTRTVLRPRKQKPSMLRSSWAVPWDADLGKKLCLSRRHGQSQTQGSPRFG